MICRNRVTIAVLQFAVYAIPRATNYIILSEIRRNMNTVSGNHVELFEQQRNVIYNKLIYLLCFAPQRIFRFSVADVQTQIPEFPNSRILKFTNSQISKIPNLSKFIRIKPK